MSSLLAPGDALRHRWSGLSRVQKWGFGVIGFGALALLLWSAATGKLKDLQLSGKSLAVACITGCLMVLNWTEL